MVTPFALPRFQALDASGVPLNGGKLWTYQSGTSVLVETFQDPAGSISNPNPVTLSPSGEATIYLRPDQLYTFALKDSAGMPVWSLDKVSGITSSTEFDEFKADLAGPDGGTLVGFRRPETGAMTRNTKAYLSSQPPQPQDKGGRPEVGFNNASALAFLYGDQPDMVDYPPGIYEVVGNFPRLDIVHSGPGAWKIIDTEEEQIVRVDSYETHGPATIYYDPVNGSDTANHGLSRSYPFKALQRAFDSLPLVIRHQQTIVQLGGVANTSSRAPSSMPRPAIFYVQGKLICPRTDSRGSEATGMVVVKGESNATIESNPSGGYPYAIYDSSSEIALQDIEVRPATTGGSQALITANRGAYVYMRRVVVNGAAGAGTTLGVVCESGSIVEMIDSTSTGATSYDLVVYAGSLASIARPGLLGSVGKVLVSGQCDIAVGGLLTGNSLVGAGGRLSFTGTSTSRVVISGDINVDPGGIINGVYADITGNIVGRGMAMRLSACGWSKTITAFGGLLRLDASRSFVAPATMSESVSPIVLRNGAEVIPDATTEIRNNANSLVGPDYGRQIVAPNVDAYVIPIALEEKVTTMTLNASGAARSNCTLGDVQGTYPGSKAPDGALLVIGCAAPGSYSTQITEGATAVIPGGSIVVGVSSGNYSGVTFQYAADVNRWRLVSVGLRFP